MQSALSSSPNSALPLVKKPVADAEFKESEHPREEHGKFTSGGGGGGGTEFDSPVKAEKVIEELGDKFPINPDNEKERMLLVGGRKVGTFEVIEREGRLRIKGIDAIESGSGVGGLLLRRILKAADRENVTVELTASSKGHQALSTTELKAWYGRHGFVDEPGFDPALGYMVRKPQLGGTKSQAEDALLRAAGLIIVTPQGDALFLRYAPDHDHGGEWGFPAGGIESNEAPDTAAARETEEETGWVTQDKVKQVDENDGFMTYATVSEDQFIPELSDEHDDWCWASLSNPPKPLHPGVKKTIDGLMAEDSNTVEDGYTQQAVAGALSAALYHLGNVWEPQLDREIEHLIETFQDRFDVSRAKARELLAPVIAKARGMARDSYNNSASTKSELRNVIQFPPAKPKETRAINVAFANGRDATLRNRRKRLARVFDEFVESEHPRGQPENAGQFTSGSGGGGGAKAKTETGQQAGGAQSGPERSANELLQHETATVDEVVNAVPGSREFLAMAREKLSQGVPTDAPVVRGGFKNPDGSWTPERAAIHKQMVQDVFTPDAVARAIPERGKRPVLDILGGRGGSGKSWFTGPEGSVDRSRSIYLNNDDFKERLPEYQGWNAALLHEESAHIGDRAETIAREAGLNTTIDGTMKSGGTLNARIDAFKKAGYEIRGHYMYTSPVNSAMRALERGVRGQEKTGKGRYVPPEYSLTSKTNEASFDSARHKMDDWEVYDNNGKAPVFFSRKAR